VELAGGATATSNPTCKKGYRCQASDTEAAQTTYEQHTQAPKPHYNTGIYASMQASSVCRPARLTRQAVEEDAS